MWHPLQWWRKRQIRALKLRLLGLDMEIERYQKWHDLLVSTIKLARLARKAQGFDGVNIHRCEFALVWQIDPPLSKLEEERFQTEKERKQLEFLLERN